MIRGIHAPNQPFSLEDFTRLRIMQPDSVKIMHTDGTQHRPQDVVRMKALGVKYFLCRLPDSVAPDGRWKDKNEWAYECIQAIKTFVPLGVLDYQLCNEPNLMFADKDAHNWRWLVEQVIPIIRKSPDVPANVRLGLAPLAWKPDTYTSVQDVWIPEQRLILNLHQFVCCHSYWQAGRYYNHPPFGGNVTHWHDVLLGDSKPYVITEWGSSCHELAGIGPKEAEQLRLAQYPAWLDWIRTKSYVESAFLYILGGTLDWQGFWPTDKILKVL